MPIDDDVDFDAFMRDRGIERLDSGKARGGARARRKATARESTRPSPPAPESPEQRRLRSERDDARARQDAAKSERDAAKSERDAARTALAEVEAELAAARAALAEVEAARTALAKERAALQRRLSAQPKPVPVPESPTLRQALCGRGIEDEGEATDVLLALLDRDPGELLDGLKAPAPIAQRLHAHVALVCRRAECQPEGKVAVVHVPPERCDVCGGSDIKVAFEILLKASRLAGVTRLVIVGGSPPYHSQLKELSRGTDLKLDLVSGRSKPGRRRARNDAERVVIWGATILDHGTSAAYEHLGDDRLIRVTHRGICGMLREVARALG